MLALVGAPGTVGNLEGYTSGELERVFREHLGIAGTDPDGALYALRDLEHDGLKHVENALE